MILVQKKILVICFSFLVLLVLLFVAMGALTAKQAMAPTQEGNVFKGPTGEPYVKGPTEPPPGK
jgi:hypothetical protein